MKIIKESIVGTLESSDVMIRIGPSDSLDITLNSSVEVLFKDSIMQSITDTLQKLDIEKAKIIIEDKGALDCVLKARLLAAIDRATDEKIQWEKIT